MPTVTPPREYEEQLELITLHLKSEGPGLLIVATPDSNAERALAEEIRLRLGGEAHIEEVRFSAESVERLSLSYNLGTLPAPRSGRAVVFVFGLDELMAADRGTAINAMNWGRERLRWSGYSVVLWVRNGTPGELGNRAPDFYSWRSDVFEFDLPKDSADRQRALTKLRMFAAATQEELRRRYCDYVIRACEWLDFRGLLQLRNVVKLPLAQVFVPLRAKTLSLHSLQIRRPGVAGVLWANGIHSFKEDEGEDTCAYDTGYFERPLGVDVRVDDVIRDFGRVLVLGEPGSGKSTLLRFLALTFARGTQSMDHRVGSEGGRLPILVSLAAFGEALLTDERLTLAAFLPRYFMSQGLPDFTFVFEECLENGTALVLLDGLDEMLDARIRGLVSESISRFLENYPDSRIIVTSRIAGYSPGMLRSGLAVVTLGPLNDDAIRQFAKQWSLAFETVGRSSDAELSPDARQRAALRAENLSAAITSHSRVRRLASNPLLLTLLALIHQQGTRLPARRVDLYRLCVEALAETWNLARSLSGRPIDLRLGERRVDEQFVVRILGPIAYWMHDSVPTGSVNRAQLEGQAAKQFVQSEDVSEEKASELARDFVNLVREHMGLLIESGPDEFRFLHLSIQEYLAGRFLVGKASPFELLEPHINDPRWEEVALLTAACLSGDRATAFLESILNAHGRFEGLIKRSLALRTGSHPRSKIVPALRALLDLLLATRCIGEHVEIPKSRQRAVVDRVFALWRNPPFAALREDITDLLDPLSGAGVDVVSFLISEANHTEQDTRVDALIALGRIEARDEDAAWLLLGVMQDKTEDDEVREYAVDSFVATQWGKAADTLRPVLDLVKDKAETPRLRAVALVSLARGESLDQNTQEMAAQIIRDKQERRDLRTAALELCFLTEDAPDAIQKAAKEALADEAESESFRSLAKAALDMRANTSEQQAATAQPSSTIELLDHPALLSDWLAILRGKTQFASGERLEAARMLSLVTSEDPAAFLYVLEIVSEIVADRTEDEGIRRELVTVLSLGTEEQTSHILLTILRDATDSPGVRSNSAKALADAFLNSNEIVGALLDAVRDPAIRNASLEALFLILERGRMPNGGTPDGFETRLDHSQH